VELANILMAQGATLNRLASTVTLEDMELELARPVHVLENVLLAAFPQWARLVVRRLWIASVAAPANLRLALALQAALIVGLGSIWRLQGAHSAQIAFHAHLENT
jgi:hypothetical protein